MQILAISGSLRAASTNTTLLKAAAALAPEDVMFNLYDGLGDLPHFNPDLDEDPPHATVAEFRFQLGKSAGVIFSSPEYAHGVPGVLKNALDWVVAMPRQSTCFDFCTSAEFGRRTTSAAIVNAGSFPGPARGLFLRCPGGVACGILPTPFPARVFGPLKRFRIGPTPISRHAH